MQRTISFFLALSLILCLFAGCGPQEPVADLEASATTEATPPVTTTAPTTEPTTESTTESASEDVYDMKIALITHGLCEGGNQLAWQGIQNFAEERGIPYNHYKTTEDSDDAAMVSIAEAVEDGANVLIFSEYLLAGPVYEAQKRYPNVRFLHLSEEAHSADYSSYETASNTQCILYKEEQMGYMAGYAAVMEGYRTIGVISFIQLPFVLYAYTRFLQGVTDAAIKLGVVDEIQIKCHYLGCGSFHDSTLTLVDQWIDGGVEVIYALSLDGYDLHEQLSTKDIPVISVITDIGYAGENVIGAFVYDYTSAVELALTILENGNGEWPEGNSTMYLGAEDNGIRLLPEGEGWKFHNFTEEEYKALYAEIAEGKIIIPRTDEIGEIPFTVEYS